MNKRMISTIVFLLAFVIQMLAEDKVTIGNFVISAGETKELSITLENEVTYAAFQFNLYLPEGLTVSEYSADKTRIPEGTTVSMSKVKDGSYRFIATAMKTNSIIGTSGGIVTVKVTADKNLKSGSLTGYFRKVKLSKVNGTGATYEEMSFPITILEPSTVTAKSYERVYGDDNPVFEYDVEGGAMDGTPEISCEATPTSPAGTYDIVVKRGTETNFNVTYVKGTLTIKKAPLTITAKDYTIKQGQALPTFEATYEGFKNSETSAVLTKQPTISTKATSASEPGKYAITVSGAEAQNYEISYVNGKLTIVDADALIVTAKDYTIEYGDEIPAFGYTSEGATLEGTPEITCEATKTSPVGTYPIVISKGSVTNYNDSYVNGTLTIKKAPLTITAKDYTIKQGQALPTFEATYEGFKNDETSAVLTKQPTISTKVTSASELGKYDINVSNAEAENYEISYVNGKLTIVDADALIVTAKDYTIEYGDEIPTLEYTSEGATLEGTPEITCEAKKTSPAGTYPIVISKGSVTNYNDTYVNGTLTIKKAPLTITAKDYTIKQGEALPTFEASYEGFKNKETSEVLTKQPTITTTATSDRKPGEYDITVSGAEAENYEISYVNGKLTIVDADAVIVTAKDFTIEYGDDIPTFEFTCVGAKLEGTPEITCEATKTSPVGTYPIVISKGSVTNYNDSYVNGTLTIKKAPLTITAKDYTIKQGEALPAFEATYEEFKNDETSAVLTKQPTITTTATSESDPGDYDITVSGAEAQNYEISYVNGKLTIVDADAVIVTAKDYTIEYGDEIPTLEYTSEGATLEGTPEITCEAKKTSPAGTYPIVISKGSVTNYNDTYVNGTLTIKKAPLTITAKDYTIKQGEALPNFEATYEGFKNDETSAVLTKQPTITTTATSDSEPGKYDITVSGAEAQNYEISYVNGKLTIVDADALIVTAKDYTIEYGEDIPTFEYTSEGAALEGTPEITCEATKTSPAGTYPIVISKGSVTNYNDSYVNGTLTIKKAPLTITAKDYTIKQGEALPAFEATYEGFKNDETSAVLKKQPTITTTATSDSEPGKYDINISGAGADNYEISYVNGRLTIEAVDITPITGEEEVTFSDNIDEETDLTDAIVDNTYITMDQDNGDGYSAEEQALVLNSTTTEEQMNIVQEATIGENIVQENYSGLIIELQGRGTLSVDAKTIGKHVLNVQIGKNKPEKMTKEERGIVDIEFSEKEPTYAYIYASSGEGNAARVRRSLSVVESCVLIYGYKVTLEEILTGDANADGKVDAADITDIANHIMGKPTSTGEFDEEAADMNGDKVINAADIVKLVDLLYKK